MLEARLVQVGVRALPRARLTREAEEGLGLDARASNLERKSRHRPRKQARRLPF
jgi:hypothetical protein